MKIPSPVRRSTPKAATALATVVAVLASSATAFALLSNGGATNAANYSTGALSAPTSPTATPSNTSVQVGWTLPGSQLSGAEYVVSRTSPTATTVCTVASSVNSCNDTSLTPGITYGYSIMAILPSPSVWQSAAVTASTTTLKETPTFANSASPASVTVGSTAQDQSVVTGGYSPTGQVAWSLYASSDSTCSSAIFTSPAQNLAGDSTYTSGAFATSAAGSYKWGVSYAGDTSNNAVSSCGGPDQSLTVAKATPGLTTQASTTVTVGGSVSDTATLSNGYNPTGTITFTLWGPSPTASCTSQVGQVTKAVSGNGQYTSPIITPAQAGTYWWTASYGGDSNNNTASDACGASNETSTVTQVTPTITTQSGAGGTVGGTVSDTAAFSGGYSATGTITWTVYGSTDTACQTPLLSYSQTATVNGDGSYAPTSPLTATAAGSYIWGFSYGGDTNNAAVSACGGANEGFTVAKASPSLSASVASNTTVGTAITPSADLAGGYSPTGTLTWTVFGPSSTAPSDCTTGGTNWTSNTAAVSGNSSYSPNGSFTPASAGTYWFYATYGGDGNNNPAQSSCGGLGTSIAVAKASPTLTASVTTTSTTLGATITPSATLASGYSPGGTVTYLVFGPSSTAPTICSSGGTTWANDTASVSGNGSYSSTAGFTPSSAGDYWWYASYGGDSNNNPAAGACGASMPETVVYAADGSGTMTASPTAVAGGSSGNTLTFTYTVAPGGMSGGEVDLTVPTASGWTGPQTSSSSSAGYVTISGLTGANVSASAGVIKVTNVTLASGNFTIVYGSGGGASGATAPSPSSATAYTFTTAQNSTGAGSATNLAGSPSVTVNSANGTGTMSVSPAGVAAGSTGKTLTFTYTAASAGMTNGEVDVAIPATWSPPQTSSSSTAGYVVASAGAVTIASTTIKVTGLTLAGGATVTVIYGSGGGNGGATVPSSAGIATFTTSQASVSGATPVVIASPTVRICAADGSGTMSVSPTSETASSTGQTLTFTFTAAAGGMSGGEVDLAVPSGWTTPQTGSSSSAGYTVISGLTGATVNVSGSTVKVTGVTLAGGNSFTVTYGSGGGAAGVAVQSSTGTATFSTSEASVATDAPGAIASSPIVSVTSASTFSANDLGQTASGSSATCSGSPTNTCSLTLTTAPTSGRVELVFALVTGAKSGITAATVSGAVTSTTPLTSVKEPTSTSNNILYVWSASPGAGTTANVAFTYSGTVGATSVTLDVVELGASNTVRSGSLNSGFGSTGSGSSAFSVSLSGTPSASNGEVVFAGTDDNASFQGPTGGGFTNLSGGTKSSYGWDTFTNTAAQTSAETFNTSASNKDFGWVAIEVVL